MEAFEVVDCATHEFKVPEKKIFEGDSLQDFQESDTYKHILMFIVKLQKVVQGTTMSTTECPE